MNLVKLIDFGELGCSVDQGSLVCEKMPVLLLLSAWAITGAKIYGILECLTFTSGHCFDFQVLYFPIEFMFQMVHW